MDANDLDSENDPCPLILLPGLMCDVRIFASQLRAFPTAIGAPDYGEASSLTAMAELVLEAAPRRFALLGHSMGARVALEVFRFAPDRVARLALVSTGVHLPNAEEASKRHALRDIGRQKGMAALVDAWLPPMVASARQSDEALVTPLRRMCVDAGMGRFEAQIEALLARPEVESLLPRIQVPTLIAVGSEDRWSPPVQHENIAARIPGATLAVVESAGHMLPAETPGALNAAIADWLAAPETPSPTSSHGEKTA
ncbi:alpha/beta fold hydrolase [Sphingomonas psychrotolerans]|uniref:Alpha/beta hydrolase n=1 Tax=Sphingomonas psychrotolerans TaxID=1327635 RepID=A0A2K8MHZ9_9SPHN|nr:alpha/beta fold hydrolase [Sphingomonas psychrotolerans]ATY33507.1 alpha/beta hydrolase [Sphingomonas psychrotolerans]